MISDSCRSTEVKVMASSISMVSVFFIGVHICFVQADCIDQYPTSTPLDIAGGLCGSSFLSIKDTQSKLYLYGSNEGQLKVSSNSEHSEAIWIFLGNPDGTVYIANAMSLYCIDIQQGHCKDEVRILTYECLGTNSQKWHLNGNGTISSYCGPQFALSVDSSSNNVVLGNRQSESGVSTFNITGATLNL